MPIMSLPNVVIILLSIFMSSVAHVFLKKGMLAYAQYPFKSDEIMSLVWIVAKNPWVMGGMLLHVSALVVWLWALSKVDISFAYPFLALGYVLVSLMAWFWLGESLTSVKLLGMVVIIVGVLILSIAE